MESIVALDIETTGLDPDKDAVIEIGVVRFNDKRVEDEWSTFVNPGRRIPPFITNLTGITDQMVLHSPPIQDVLSDLQSFVGNSPVLGHNVRFDLSFLRRHGVLRDNTALDSYEMASVLLPSAWVSEPRLCPTLPRTAPWMMRAPHAAFFYAYTKRRLLFPFISWLRSSV
jgi:ATP-dependent DNA helicase DinG